MPTIGLKRDLLFTALGRTYTDDEFADLCFELGLELDEVTSEQQMIKKEQGAEQAATASEEVIYRIDIPANRYDLLCLEGLVRAILIFQGLMQPPQFIATVDPIERLNVLSNTKLIRPYAVSAILRNIKFTQDTYNSFIDLQDKLHHNICRKRTLVAIGTHDLDTIQGPFYYDAKPPGEIKFVPLNQTKVFTGAGIMDLYANHAQLKQYLPIIRDSPVYPVITDSHGVVLSLPPIINGDHSKITLKTKNVFIECTATDLKKAEIVLDTLVCMFSQYCATKYSVERVEIVMPDGSKKLQPRLEDRYFKFNLTHATKLAGITETKPNVMKLLGKMGLNAIPSKKEASPKIKVGIPPTRHDIIHERDVFEDLAIAYGYNNIKKTFPKTPMVAQEFPLNKLCDLVREEVARCGFTEALTFTLCSTDDISCKMGKDLSLLPVVHVSNPKTLEFQVCRTEILPCILKTIASNKGMPLPINIFEVSDVILIDKTMETGARNERHLCAVHYNKTAGFEIIHGLLDRVMLVLGVPFDSTGYQLLPSEDPAYFPKRCAEIVCKGEIIGKMGILHPKVIKDFELALPASALEINLEPFL